MQLFRGTLLLFLLNIIDAVLTLFWVRSGIAPEGNHIMAALLDNGDAMFLIAKIGWGILTAIVLLKWGHKSLAKYGLSIALVVYFSVMGVHVMTGLMALGYVAQGPIDEIQSWSRVFVAIFL